ncbi:MAG: hypothetical protein AAFX76_05335 [Planctomycetota bacterium]
MSGDVRRPAAVGAGGYVAVYHGVVGNDVDDGVGVVSLDLDESWRVVRRVSRLGNS